MDLFTMAVFVYAFIVEMMAFNADLLPVWMTRPLVPRDRSPATNDHQRVQVVGLGDERQPPLREGYVMRQDKADGPPG